MVRSFALAFLVLSCLATAGRAQSPPPSTPAASKPAAAKPTAKKAAPKVKPAAKQPVAVESGPCQIGVISAIGDQFTIQHIGLTAFGNEYMEAPIDGWGLDDLLVARARAAAPGTAIRKITYAKGAFRPYDHPEAKLFRNDREELTAVVRQIAGTANCERYIVATKASVESGGTNQALAGVGVWKNWASPAGRGVVVANFRLTVFDGRTFEIQRAPSRNFGEVLATNLLGKDDNIRILNNLEFPKTPEEATNNALLRDNARGLVAAELDKSLPAYLKGE